MDDLRVNDIVRKNLEMMVFGGEISMHHVFDSERAYASGEFFRHSSEVYPCNYVNFLYKGMGEFIFFSNNEEDYEEYKDDRKKAKFLVIYDPDKKKNSAVKSVGLPKRGVITANIEKTVREYNRKYGFQLTSSNVEIFEDED